mmetsp:Transcript_9381/g.15564  ORF Transcript_9381/g.15564 Transcript_9381/m.15564 type:complete len:353 (-) Transcript_9381:73-1131(-)
MQHVPAHLAAGGVDSCKDTTPTHFEGFFEADARLSIFISLQGPVKVRVLLPLVQLIIFPFIHETLNLSTTNLPADVKVVLHELVLLRFNAQRLDQKSILEGTGNLDAGAQTDLGSSDEFHIFRVGGSIGIGDLHQVAKHDRGKHIEGTPFKVGVEVRSRGGRSNRRKLGNLNKSRCVPSGGRGMQQIGLHEGPYALPVLTLPGEAHVVVRNRLESRILLPLEDAPRALGHPAGIRTLAPQYLHHLLGILDDVASVLGAIVAAETGHPHGIEIAELLSHLWPKVIRLVERGDAAVGPQEGADARQRWHFHEFRVGDIRRTATVRLIGVDGTAIGGGSSSGGSGGMGAGRFGPA